MNYDQEKKDMKTITIKICIIICIFSITPQITYAFSEKEIYSGYYVDQIITGNSVIIYDEQATALLSRISEKLAQAVGCKEHFTLRIINYQNINAYAGPGGFIYITTGLLEFVEKKDELAMIIAHEMAHSLEGHYIRSWEMKDRTNAALGVTLKIAKVQLSFLGLSEQLPSSALKEVTERLTYSTIQGSINVILNFGALRINEGMMSGYSQELEFEADSIAVKYAIAAQFNPRAFIAFFKRLKYIEAKSDSTKNIQHISTFINDRVEITKRIEHIEKILATQ
ncbi:MAG: M48 family metallopeptidase [Desulfobacterales bacterium]|nr:M48 family metallopeptidase [Desulfobacterales bacterium]